MTFEQDYDKLLQFAKKIILEKGLRVAAGDLVNDAFIRFSEDKKPYLIGIIRSYISSGMFREMEHQYANYSEFTSKKLVKQTSRYCHCCKNDLPMCGFYTRTKKGLLTISSDCKSCTKKKAIERYNADKQKWLERSKEWKEANKERVRQKKQEYHRKNYIPRPPRKKIITEKPIPSKRTRITDDERRKRRREYERKKHGYSPRKKAISAEEKRLRQNERMRLRRTAKNIKPKRIARPIHELWKEANRRYYAKKKAMKMKAA